MVVKKVNLRKVSWKSDDNSNSTVKFKSDYNLPLNKILKLHNLTVIGGSVFEKNGKYYPQVFSDECLHELYTA